MSVDLNLKCRTCLSGASAYQLHDYVEENYKILDMLNGIVPEIDFKTATQFPPSMCKSCVNKLIIGYKFRQLCIATNNRLHDLWGMSLFKAEPEQISVPITGILRLKEYQEIEDHSTEIKVSPNELEGEISLVNVPNSGGESNTDLSSSNCQENPTSTGNKFCNICKQGFRYYSGLKDHMRIHNGEKPFVCSQCGRRYRTTTGLHDHMQRHKGLKKHQCPECPKRYYTKRDLIKHQKVHVNNTNLEKEENAPRTKMLEHKFQEKANEAIENVPLVTVREEEILKPRKTPSLLRYACETCGKRFSCPSLLKNHSPVHSLARSHECQICDYRFSTARALTIHLSRHVNGTLNNTKSHKSKNALTCSVCEKKFSNFSNMRKHRISVHSVGKAYKCKECAKRFSCSDYLRVHMRTHSDKRPYQCSQCDKAFRHWASLKHHMEGHRRRMNSPFSKIA